MCEVCKEESKKNKNTVIEHCLNCGIELAEIAMNFKEWYCWDCHEDGYGSTR